MNISIKNFEDIEKMRIAGKLAAEVLEMITPFVKPGVSTGELDKLCYDHIVNVQNAIPANVGYKGYAKTICSSINQVICHGIPNNEKFLKDGDILNIDVTVIKDGWHGDTSKMFLVGKCAPHNQRLVQITKECLYKGIEAVKPGAYLEDIGNAIKKNELGRQHVDLQTLERSRYPVFSFKKKKRDWNRFGPSTSRDPLVI